MNHLICIVCLCHFHALSSFVLGCGILNEPTAEGPEKDNNGADPQNVAVPEILQKMEDLRTQSEELDVTEVARRFESIKVQDAQEIFPSEAKSRSRSSTPASEETSDDQEIKFIEPVKYTTDLEFQYVDFVQREHPEESPTFREAVS